MTKQCFIQIGLTIGREFADSSADYISLACIDN